MNDTNKDQNCRGITCKSHSARSERADLYRICPSKLSKRELEDMYYALLENNLDLKRTVNGQKDKIKVLSTKVHRITTAQKNGLGKEQMCCSNAKAVICEQKESIADLKKANERMMERIRLLNMRLCSAKQFLKCAPTQQSTSRCMNRCLTAVPTTTSLKNCSSTAINTKGSVSILRSVAVSCEDFVKDGICTQLDKTEASEHEKEDSKKPCDQNRCQTVMEELKQKIVNLQEELSKSHEEYCMRISRVESEMCSLREENVRMRGEHALAAAGLRARDQRAEDLAAKLRGAEAHYSELALQLCLERKRVSELETRVRAESMSCQVVKTIQEHLSNIHAVKDKTEQTPASQQNVSKLNDMQAKKESDNGPSSVVNLSPIYTTPTEWDTSTPRSNVHSTSRDVTGAVAKNIFGNEENKTVKYSDDSGFLDLNKAQDVNEEKNKVNEVLMKRLACLQNQLETLNDSTAENSNDREIKLNDKCSDTAVEMFEAQKNERESMTSTLDTVEDKTGGRRFKHYNDSSDTITQQYDEQKNIIESTVSISIQSEQNNNETNYLDDLKYMNDLENSSKYSTHMSALHVDKNLTFHENDDQKNYNRLSTVMKNWQYPAEQSSSKATRYMDRGGVLDSELSVLPNSKDAIKLVEAPSKKDDNHNSYQIPGPISVYDSKGERKSLRQIFVEGINRRKSKDNRLSKDVIEKLSTVPKKGTNMQKCNTVHENNNNDEKSKTQESFNSTANTQMTHIYNPDNKMQNVDVVCQRDPPKNPKEKNLSFEDDEKRALKVADKSNQDHTDLTNENEEIKVSDDKTEASDAQSQINPTTLQPAGYQTQTIEEKVGTQKDRSEVQPENIRSVSQSAAQTYTLNPNENKCTRATTPDNTENEISSLADLPSDKDGKSPRVALSPGEDKATTTYTDSCTTPTTTDYGSLSEGEVPSVRTNQPTKLASREKDVLNTAASNTSPSQKMEAALQAITEELARCRQLLMSQTSEQEQLKSASKDVFTSMGLANERLALKKAPASPRIGDTIVPKCVFTLHIGTVIMSDEAVMNSRNMTLVLMWKFFDQNVTMTRMRTGRVILFDFSTEYDVRLTDEFLNYLKYEEMPIIVCEMNKQEEPFASCALPFRDALLNTNRRTDMSLPLVAGPHMKRALTAADGVEAGDEVGVVDLWCRLRLRPDPGATGPPAVNHLLARIHTLTQPDAMAQKSSGKDNFSEPANDGQDSFRGNQSSSQQPDMGDPTVTKDDDSEPSRINAPLNNYLGNMGIRFSPSQICRPSRGAKKQFQRTKWYDKHQVQDDEAQDYSGLMKEIKRTSKHSQGLRDLKDDGSDENLSKNIDNMKLPKSVTIEPKQEKCYTKCDERQRVDEDSIMEQDDPEGTQSLTITVLWLALNEECEAMVNPKVQRLYVAYTFLGRSGAELETPVSLPKPKHYVDKCCFNFSKTFQLHDCDLLLVGHMARCRSSNIMSGDPRDCIVFTVISEPPEDPLGLDSCEDIGYAQLYLGDVMAYSAGSGEYTEVVPVRASAGDVVGVLAVRIGGLHVVRRCVALSHSHRDLTHYWNWSVTSIHYTRPPETWSQSDIGCLIISL